jgi:hypothetical protein
MTVAATLTCEFCGKPLQRGLRGPKPRFCDAHRQPNSRRLRVVASPPTPVRADGVMSKVAARIAAKLSPRQDEPDPLMEGLLASLALVAAALDATPGSASSWTVWRGLLRDLPRGQEGGGAARAELAAVMAGVLPPSAS